MRIKDGKCSACGQCVEVCPTKAIYYVQRNGAGYAAAAIDQSKCVDCGTCKDICPADAFTMG